MANKPWHQGAYRSLAAQVRAAANANPHTTCWRCGQLARPGDPWTAGHINDSQINGPLAAEHRSCNTKAGGALGAQRKASQRLTTTRQW